MNTLHFVYAVEVERCGSITQAAENLYMAQPNLSKAIKELEDNMGFAIFSRTSRGVVPTARGREFLVYARAILAQMQKMEALSGRNDDSMQRFSLSMPRTGYIAECFTQLIDTLDKGRPMDICVREASAVHTINEVADGQFQLGIIRYQTSQEQRYVDYLQEKSLASQVIWEYDALLLLSRHHPLAARTQISFEDLAPYTEIIYGDTTMPHQPPMRRVEDEDSRIQVYGRLSQLELLSRVQESYMWASPETAEALKRFALVQRACQGSGMRFKDVLVYPAAYRLSNLDQRFMELLLRARDQLSRQIYA